MTKTYKKLRLRSNILICFVFFSWISLCLRLFQIQVLNGAEYQSQVLNQTQKKQIILPSRGNIFDRHNRPLTRNIIHYTLSVNPSKILDKYSLAEKLSSLTGNPVNKYIEKFNSKSKFVYIERNLQKKDLGDLQMKSYEGLKIEKLYRRYYPHNQIAAQLLGYTNYDNEGISGIEKTFNKYLKGQPGWIHKTTGYSGKMQHKSGMPYKKSINGNNIQLTLDLNYQSILEEELYQRQLETNALSATGIIIDPQTGEILALATTPGFNNNDFSKSDPSNHRIRAITDQFEPGSTYKVVSAVSALYNNKITPQDEFNCEDGEYEYYTIPIKDHEKYGILSTSQIIQYSSNIGIIKIIENVGPKILHNTSKDFGFGSKTGINIEGEVSGTLNPFPIWSAVSLGQIAMGHEVGVTAIQLTMAYCAIANGGYLLKPRIIKQIIDHQNSAIYSEGPSIIRKIADEKTMNHVKMMLRDVIINGTGNNAQIPGWKIAGKTGTAQKWIGGKYSNDKFISNFVGFFPIDNPQLLSLIIIDEPKQPYHWGGQGAAVAFKRIIKRIINMDDYIVPPTILDQKKDYHNISQVSQKFKKNTLAHKSMIPMDLSIEKKYSNAVIKIPELRGMSMRKAMEELNKRGIKYKINGSGKVIGQSPVPGSIVNQKTICYVDLKL